MLVSLFWAQRLIPNSPFLTKKARCQKIWIRKIPRSPDEYKSVAGYGEAEFIIEKSRFIGYALPVSSEEEARAFIAELRDCTAGDTRLLGLDHRRRRTRDAVF